MFNSRKSDDWQMEYATSMGKGEWADPMDGGEEGLYDYIEQQRIEFREEMFEYMEYAEEFGGTPFSTSGSFTDNLRHSENREGGMVSV
jgi:hypothetical protein